jgi:hypothetical protein
LARANGHPVQFYNRRGQPGRQEHLDTYERWREQARLQIEQRDRGRPVYELLDVEPERDSVGFRSRAPETSSWISKRTHSRGYSGLAAHPGHDIARRQMHAFGSIVSFDLATRGRAESFLRALKLVREATSFGGVHSTAERRARWGGDAIGDGFIRLSVGCESADDLLEDIGGALHET